METRINSQIAINADVDVTCGQAFGNDIDFEDEGTEDVLKDRLWKPPTPKLG